MMTSEFMAAATSSRYQQWATDPRVVKDIAPYFPWSIDVCAHDATICKTYWTEEDDCLIQDWKPYKLRWMNPEYGRKIGKFIHKASLYHGREKPDGVTICLVPARPDTAWFQDHAPLATQITYIRGRLTFGSDAYWQYLWDQPFVLDAEGNPVIKDGRPKKNSLYQKYGRKDAAPFPSCFMVFGWGLTPEQRVKLDSYGRSEWPQTAPMVTDLERKHYPEAAKKGIWKKV